MRAVQLNDLSLQTDYRGDDEWHRDHLCGQAESQLRAELEMIQKQLKCAHDTHQEQKNKIQSLRYFSHEQARTPNNSIQAQKQIIILCIIF